MIYEIGTFIYITLNIYYESLKESLKDDTFISRIKEIKKNLNFSIKEVKSKNIFKNAISFFKIGWKIITDIFYYSK